MRGLCRIGLPNPTVPQRYRGSQRRPCEPFGPRERFQGVWVRGFETSAFYPYPHAEEALVRRGITYAGDWLTADMASDPQKLLARFPDGSGPLGHREMQVTFDGWATEARNGFGHLGAYDREMLVDRFVAVGPVAQPTEQDYRRWRRILDGRR